MDRPSVDSQQGMENLSPAQLQELKSANISLRKDVILPRPQLWNTALCLSLVRLCCWGLSELYVVLSFYCRVHHSSNRWIQHSCLGLPYHKQLYFRNQGDCNPQRSWEQEGWGIYLSGCLAGAEQWLLRACGSHYQHEEFSKAQQPSQLQILTGSIPSARASSRHSQVEVMASSICVWGTQVLLKTYLEPQRWTDLELELWAWSPRAWMASFTCTW